MIKKERVWLRIAANQPAWTKDGQGKSEGEKSGLWWRVFIKGTDGAEEMFLLKAIRLAGLAGGGNNATSAQSIADGAGVRAWISCFGDITIDEHQVALIVFRDPSLPEFKIHEPE